MTEAQFTEINIVGHNASKPPRKDGKNKAGKDQFIISFNLSMNANVLWVETFNRMWGEHSKQTNTLQLPIVKDDHIQIICSIDDQLQDHLDDLKREITKTNRVYLEHLRATDKEKRSNDEILQKLRF